MLVLPLLVMTKVLGPVDVSVPRKLAGRIGRRNGDFRATVRTDDGGLRLALGAAGQRNTHQAAAVAPNLAVAEAQWRLTRSPHCCPMASGRGPAGSPVTLHVVGLPGRVGERDPRAHQPHWALSADGCRRDIPEAVDDALSWRTH